jgi:hypothetical protein
MPPSAKLVLSETRFLLALSFKCSESDFARIIARHQSLTGFPTYPLPKLTDVDAGRLLHQVSAVSAPASGAVMRQLLVWFAHYNEVHPH